MDCKYCTKENIKVEIKRYLDNNGMCTLPMFLPHIGDDEHSCSLGCQRVITREEWYQAEKEIMAEFYGGGILGKVRKFMFMICRDKIKTLRLADDLLEELKEYINEEVKK